MGRFDGHDPRSGTDTAGVPWAGRTLTGTGFDEDLGYPDVALTEALEHADDVRAVVAAVRGARLLVPVVAVAAEPAGTASGRAGDASSDMATVTLTAPDGTRALPAFTSLAALAAWDEQARPVPVPGQRAAQAAVQELCDVILLDLVPDRPAPAFVLRPSMVWALAMDRAWQPAHEDEVVAVAVAAAVGREAGVRAHRLGGGADGSLRVTLELTPGMGREEVQAVVTRIGQRIATDGEARARIDAVSFALRPAG